MFHDLLGLFDALRPKFVKRYAELGRDAVAAMHRYADEVRAGAFPGPEHCFHDKLAGKGSEARPSGGSDPATPEPGYLAGCDRDRKD